MSNCVTAWEVGDREVSIIEREKITCPYIGRTKNSLDSVKFVYFMNCEFVEYIKLRISTFLVSVSTNQAKMYKQIVVISHRTFENML